MSLIGQSIERIEDAPLLRGAGRYVADLVLPGQLVMRVVRSPVARGRITRIDTTAARDLPGVHTVWTGVDVADVGTIRVRGAAAPDLERHLQPVLAHTHVRYAGEPVAVVFAADAYVAEDAADLVEISVAEESAHRCPPLQPDDVIAELPVILKSCGDLEQAFAAAAAVVELTVAVGRHSGVPLETRGALVAMDASSGVLTMYGAAKSPHLVRDAIAQQIGLAPDRIQLSECHVGGGFGVRGELYPEDILVCLGAMRLQRPVKWIEDRYEHLVAANHSRDQRYTLRAAVDRQGRILGLDVELVVDQGAYLRPAGTKVADLAAGLLPGPYRIPAYRARARICFTSKTPAGTYRSPGRYESTFARERLIDAIAERLGLDAVAVRCINFIAPEQMPFDRGLSAGGRPVVLDSGRYQDLLERALAHFAFGEWDAAARQRRRHGEWVGVGVAAFVEKSGIPGVDRVRINLDAGGRIEVITGAASVGQGMETALAQICGDVLGVGVDRIRVVHGQTARIVKGMGAFASIVTVMTGSAVQRAAQALKVELLARGGELLQAPPGQLTCRDGSVVANQGDAAVSFAEIARTAQEGGAAAALTAEGEFQDNGLSYPYGFHFAQVRVDPRTFTARVERFAIAYDVGCAINPRLVQGQLQGGAVQGIGGALLESFDYDETGQPLSTSFADYLLPRCTDVPEIEILLRADAPSPTNPLGAKGAGEGGVTAAGAAIAAAIDAAIGQPGAITALPVTPAVLHAILARGAATAQDDGTSGS